MKLLTTSCLLLLSLLCSSVLGTSAAFADVPVTATLCNQSERPVEFWLFNHNDLSQGLAALSTKAVRACSCVDIQTHTDLWHNFPIARINQLVYRDVSSVSGSSIKVCVDVKGSFEGYIDAKNSTCVEARKETNYLPAPELTRAQGDLVILDSSLHADNSECRNRDWTGGCTHYDVDFHYTDGQPCHGN